MSRQGQGMPPLAAGLDVGALDPVMFGDTTLDEGRQQTEPDMKDEKKVEPVADEGGDGLNPDDKKKVGPWYEEEALARALGVVRCRLERSRQKLVFGEVWRYDHGRVAYTREGAVAVMERVGIKLPEKKAGEYGYGRRTLGEVLEVCRLGRPGVGLEGCERFMVTRLALNTRVVNAAILSSNDLPYGFECRVIVGDSKNFVRGMELIGQPVAVEQFLYRLVGPLPRRKGRW